MNARVKFRMVRGRSWNGNGFGTDPAWWDAEIDGEDIAKWRPGARRGTGEIYGKTTFAVHTYRQWRTAVLEAVERHLGQKMNAQGEKANADNPPPADA